MNLRRCLLALLILLFICTLPVGIEHAIGNAVYILSTGAGTNSGNDCADAKPYSYFNTSGNWSASPTGVQIGPGTTVHLCPETITNSSNNGTELTTKGNGSIGTPVLIIADGTVNFNSTGWWGAYSDGGTMLGAINIVNAYITLNGANNLTIQNMFSGCVSGCAGGVPATCVGGACTKNPGAGGTPGSSGIYVSGDNVIIENTTVKNIYQNAGNDSSATDVGGYNTVGINNNASTNLQIANNHISDASIGINSANPGGSGANTGPNSCPSAGYCFYLNVLSDCHWMIASNSTSSNVGGMIYNIYANTWGDWTNWYNPTGTYHLDGDIGFGYNHHKVTIYFFANTIFGEQGSAAAGGNSTATGVYCSSTQLVDSSGSSCYIYNNIFYVADPNYIAGMIAIGGPDRCGISSWSINGSNVLTLNLHTGTNCTNGISTWNWQAGEPIILAEFASGSFLNNQTITISTINSTTITASFTHAATSGSESNAQAYDAGNMGPYFLANNTFINGSAAFGSLVNYTYANQPAYYQLTQENNIFDEPSSPSPGAYFESTSNGISGWTGGMTSSTNIYWNDRASLFIFGNSGWWGTAPGSPNTGANNFAAWKTFCGCDASSAYENPLVNTDGTLQNGSPAVGFGTNLTSLGINSLNIDKNGNARPSIGNWTVGALNATSSVIPPKNLTVTGVGY